MPDLKAELRKLKYLGLVFGDCVEVFGVDADEDPYAKAARGDYAIEGSIEIDDFTVLSNSSNGNYVMAWVWVSDEDAGITPEEDAE